MLSSVGSIAKLKKILIKKDSVDGDGSEINQKEGEELEELSKQTKLLRHRLFSVRMMMI